MKTILLRNVNRISTCFQKYTHLCVFGWGRIDEQREIHYIASHHTGTELNMSTCWIDNQQKPGRFELYFGLKTTTMCFCVRCFEQKLINSGTAIFLEWTGLAKLLCFSFQFQNVIVFLIRCEAKLRLVRLMDS